MAGWMVHVSPETVRVTLVYRDTLAQGAAGWMVSSGISQDCHNFFGVPGYFVTGGGWVDVISGHIPGLSELLWYTGILCHWGSWVGW